MAGESVSLRAAAEELGVHYMTAYRYVRTGRLPAVKSAGQWFVDRADIEALNDGTDLHVGDGLKTRSVGQLEDRLLAADEPGSWAVVSQALTSGAEPAEVHIKMLIPAMQSIGERWASGDIEVFDEHQATVIATRITARLGPRFHRRGRTRGRAIVGLVSGDTHALTTAIIADLLRGMRFDVTDLGADTPAASFVEVLGSPDDEPVIGVAISSSTSATLDQAAETIAHIREHRPDVVIALGGAGVTTQLEADAAGATLWSPDVQGLLDHFDQLGSAT